MVNIAFSLPYNAFTKLIVSLFAFIDSIFYNFFSLVTWGFTSVMNVTLISNDQIQKIISRFYVIIGIYMLFRLALMLINSIIDPDKMFDKNAGMQKIISRVIITLMMLMFVPSLFTFALDAQNDILATIPKIVLGRGDTMTADNNKATAENIALTTWSAFVVPNDDCKDQDINDGIIHSGGATSNDMKIYDMVNEKCNESNTDSKVFKYTYWFLISTVAAIFLIIVMLVYTVNVATRLFKLAVLQILSPIAIVSYIDPKGDKNGPFNSWLKLTIQTYLDIFIKMAVVYFVLALISTALEGIGQGEGGSFNIYATIFVIIGGFAFMLGASKFINKALGINKDKEKGTFGRLLGTAATGLVYGGLAGAAGSVIQSGMMAAHDQKGLGFLKSFGKGAFNMEALKNGLKTGASNGFAAGEKFSLGSSFNIGRDMQAMVETGDPKAKHKTMQDRIMDKAIRRQLEARGVNNGTLSTAQENIDKLSKIKTNRQTYRQNVAQLKSALSNREQLEAQKTHLKGVINSSKVGTDKYRQAVSDLADVNSEIVKNDVALQNAKNTVLSVQSELNNRFDMDIDENGVQGVNDIRYDESKYQTSGSLDSLIESIDANIYEREKTIADANKALGEVKPVYKAAKGKVHGKPTDYFGIGSDFTKVNQTGENKNKV